ncbi:MAG: amidohydrolase family protein [Gammaproteobacteria bacterium]|nr:amidohydrolase family protein [Gammaproteobacteria bacterium]
MYLPAELADRYRDRLSQAGQGAAQAKEALKVRKQIIKRLHDAGVGVLLGADSPQIFNVPGFAIHRELQAMVAAGLSPEEALRTGTTAPARYFGRSEDFGALRPGLSADLVWIDGDPTADIGNAAKIRGVMVRGRWLDRDELDAGLQAIAER